MPAAQCRHQQHTAVSNWHLTHQVSIVVSVTTHLQISELVCAPWAPATLKWHTSVSKETVVALDLGWTGSQLSYSQRVSAKGKHYECFSRDFLIGKTPRSLANKQSYKEILQHCLSASSEYYHITAPNGSQVQVYCDMNGTNCGGEGGWMRVAYVNMSESSTTCPERLAHCSNLFWTDSLW